MQEAWTSGQLEQAVDSTAAGLVVLRHDGRVLFANEAARSMLGAPKLGRGSEHIEQWFASVTELLDGDGTERSHITAQSGPARGRTFGYSVSKLRDNMPGSGRYVLLFQDISQIVALREERDRLLKLAAVGEAMPTLLHELRNPMASLTTALEVLIDECEDTSLMQRLHAILGEARRVNLGLQGIGTVGRELCSNRHHALDYAIRETCKLMHATAREAGVELRVEVSDMPLLPVDAATLKGLLFNLLNNSIAATKGGGYVRVSCKYDEVGQSVVMNVSDNGSGMSPHVLEHCTDLFFTTKKRGSGIGLALCEQTVDSAGGRMVIQSTQGQGTSITLHLPIGTGRRDSTAKVRRGRSSQAA